MGLPGEPVLVITPSILSLLLGVSGEALDTSGLKLTLGEVYEFDGEGFLGAGGERRLPDYMLVEPFEEDGRLVYRLPPGAYLVRYREVVRVPVGFVAFAYPRSTLLRMGASLHSAVWDSGYEGRGVGLLVVHNRSGIVIEEGAHIAQLVYLPVIGEPPAYRGAYQGEGLGEKRL